MHDFPLNTTPDFLAIGHVTKDLHNDGSFSLGGTATFAALTAQRLGLTAAIVTSADPTLIAALPGYLPNIALHAYPSAATTTFVNRYTQGFRTQHLLARAELLDPSFVPPLWHAAPIVLLGPLAQELSPAVVSIFSRRSGTLIAATPQGWLRRWDTDTRIWPTPWHDAERVLPLLDALILSHDDLLPFANGQRNEADTILAHWSSLVPLLVATDGRRGATLFHDGRVQRFPAYPAIEVDPTGAGDVFAAAFLTHLHRHHNPPSAVEFANCTASFSIEQEGTRGIPTLAMVEQRMSTIHE